ncbi:hypothetical protein EIN_162160 [Entamoeba invadens IP1]|uniref:TLDc domain-containing protein n=1 Tax=Entamoeba invadens IP1 TaxID=370355 RepID=A0A0A1U1T9_ENTIV|nr:hypothetical protein EIN_162160 [Entamoeba invadens IP1]ELP86582.1 hypothetical protein EIN_162160 [Entamoeba invadens IP1]|eukprot:XP_004185928.1 hypothetical protein EIN_162160 [Entamoeba invadens IP1]
MGDDQLLYVIKCSKYYAEWTDRHCGYQTLYDSDTDGLSNLTLNHKVMNKPHCLFICFAHDHIFGTYSNRKITTIDPLSDDYEKSKDSKNFAFSLLAPHLESPRKYPLLPGKRGSLSLHDMNTPCWFDFGYGASRVYVHKPTSKSFVKQLARSYEGLTDEDYVGCSFPSGFTCTRIVVLQIN